MMNCNMNKNELMCKKCKPDKSLTCIFAVTLATMFVIMLGSVIIEARGNNKIEEGNSEVMHESTTYDHDIIIPSANTSITETTTTIEEETIMDVVETEEVTEAITEETIEQFCRNINDEDKYLLAKIAMAEAEGESIEVKIMVILTVLNRVNSDARYFPDSVEEVIFQCSKNVYQFSPIAPDGRWWRVEPNEECWEAVEIVNSMEEDISNGALYFESCKGESWHSKNLEFIRQIGPMKFYK